MNIFVITPHKSDPYFEQKKILLFSMASATKNKILIAKNENTEQNAEQSLKLLEFADLIIADLSFERPSCYFETGFAQAKGKNVFLIAVRNTTIHQVKLKSKVHFYKDLNEYEKTIREILTTNKFS